MTSLLSILIDAIGELKRRRIFRAAGAYTLAAWLVVEMSSVVLPAFELPDWTVRLVIILALGGFPVAMLLAWAFDITPQGVVSTPPVPEKAAAKAAGNGASRSYTTAMAFSILILLVLSVGMLGYLYFSPAGTDASEQPSIAVLPFANLSDDPDNEYFSDGITEELLNALVRIDGLQVAARTSSFAFKGKNSDIRAIGRELNVATVLEGSVRKFGNQLRITVQLIDVRDGFHLWSETYDRELNDIFAIQEDISQAVVDALKVQLIGEARPTLVNTTTVDSAAYNYYLLGRYNWHKRTPESLTRAVQLFEQAIATDPDFALAYSGLADAYILLNEYGDLSFETARAKAKPAIAMALRLDKNLAEPYASLGLLKLNELDFESAEQALRGAIDINPNYAMAHNWLGLVLKASRGPSEALEEFETAAIIDPLNPAINANLAETLSRVGRYEEGKQYWQRIIDVTDDSHVDWLKAIANWAREAGKLDDMLQYARLVYERDPNNAVPKAILGSSYVILGEIERGNELLGEAYNEMPDAGNVASWRYLGFLAEGRFADLASDAGQRLKKEIAKRDKQNNQLLLLWYMWAGLGKSLTGDHRLAVRYLNAGIQYDDEHKFFEPHDRAFFQSSLAYSYMQMNEPDKAQRVIDQALERIEDGERLGWSLPRLTATKGLLYAFQNRRAEAMALFREAYANGWRDYWWISRDPKFDALRDYSSFKKMLSDMQNDYSQVQRIALVNN